MRDFFILPKDELKAVEKVDMYKTAQKELFKLTRDQKMADSDNKAREIKSLFGFTEKEDDFGDTFVCRKGETSLEIFKSSGSYWYCDNSVLGMDTLKAVESKYPSDDDALTNINDLLIRYNIDRSFLSKPFVTRTQVSISNGLSSRPKEHSTDVTVHFNFQINSVPVIGPGAKISATFGADGKLAEFICFWRAIKKDFLANTKPYTKALDSLDNHPRFANFTKENAKVKLESSRLCYYAMPPFEEQWYLIPVYEISATESTKLYTDKSIKVYIPAVNISDEDYKRLGYHNSPLSSSRIPAVK